MGRYLVGTNAAGASEALTQRTTETSGEGHGWREKRNCRADLEPSANLGTAIRAERWPLEDRLIDERSSARLAEASRPDANKHHQDEKRHHEQINVLSCAVRYTNHTNKSIPEMTRGRVGIACVLVVHFDLDRKTLTRRIPNER